MKKGTGTDLSADADPLARWECQLAQPVPMMAPDFTLDLVFMVSPLR